MTITAADLRRLEARRPGSVEVQGRARVAVGPNADSGFSSSSPWPLRVFLPIKLRNPLNGSWGGWHKHARLARQMRDQATTALYLGVSPGGRGRILRQTSEPKRVTFCAHVSRLWDDDNIPGAIKPYRDALVTMGILKDDGPKAGNLFIYEQSVKRYDGQRGVEIIIQPLPSGATR